MEATTLNQAELYQFSVFQNPVKNITPLKNVSLEDVYKVIISDKYKAITERLRLLPTKPQRNEFKETKFDYVTFSGIFTKRATGGLVQHSNLLCIDVDNIENLDGVKTKVIELLPPSLMFVSPSGNGLKIVYKINIEQATHLQYFKAFEQFFVKEFTIDIDEKCKDVSRACFLCYDKEAYYNSEAEIIDKSFIDTFYTEPEKVPQIAQKTVISEPITDYSIIMERVKTWLNKKDSYVNGKRHGYLTKLTGAYNRYGIPQHLAESDILSFCQSDCKQNDLLNIVKGIYKNTEWHNTAKFEINNPYEFTIDEVEVNQKEVEPTPLLPIEGLPDYLQSFINEYVDVYNCPRDYIAASVIFSTALAIGNKLELIGKYENVPVLWLAIVGNVSTGKTEPLSSCLSFFNKKDNAAFKQYQKEKSLYLAEQEKPKKERDTSLQLPCWYQYILNDYTPEALARVHSINNRGLCIYRDELKGWLDDFGRYAKSGEQSNMLTSFFAKPIKFNRASSEPINIEKPYIYVSGGIQPDLLPTLANDSRADSGFLSRFIFAYPDLQIKQNYSKKKLKIETLTNYHKYLEALTGIDEVVNISLSDEAENVYENWFNDNAKKTNDEPTGYLKGVYGKLDVYALRLAIVVHGMKLICNQETNTEITKNTMQTAIDLTEYFRATALKVYHKIFIDGGNSSNSNMNKKDVAKYLHSLGISQTEIAKTLNVSQQYINKILK